MGTFLQSAGEAAFRRAFEEAAEPVIERALREGLDDNATVKEILKAANRLPGFRLAGTALAKTLGELLAEQADRLWARDTRPQVAVYRTILKGVGPALAATADAGADVLERLGDQEVDRAVSSSRLPVDSRRAQLDQGVFLWPGEFSNRILIPAKNADGTIRYDAQNVPIILDPDVMALRHAEKYTRSTTRTVSGGKGQPSKQVTDPPARPNILGPFALIDAMQMIDLRWFSPEDAEAIQKLLAPKAGYYQSWGADVWRVIRGYNRALARRLRESGDDPLVHEEVEGLVQTLLRAQPDLALVRELVGEAFKGRLLVGGERDGELHPDAIDELEQIVFDMWLGGEQPRWTKIIRGIRRLRRSAVLRGVSQGRVLWAIIGLASPIWVSLAICLTLAVFCVWIYIRALFQDLGTPVAFPPGSSISGMRFVLLASLAASWIMFLDEQLFKLFRTATGWLASRSPNWSPETVHGILRKVRIFAFFLPHLNAYAALAGASPDFRFALLVPVGMAIAIASMSVEAGWAQDVNNAVRWASKPMSLFLVTLPLVVFLVMGTAAGNPVEAQGAWGSVQSFWAFVMSSKALQSAALLVSVIVLGILVRWIERVRVTGDFAIKQKIPGARWGMAAIAVLGLLAIWFNEPAKGNLSDLDLWNSQVGESDVTVKDGKSKMRTRTVFFQDGTTRTRVTGRLDTRSLGTPKAPAPVPTTPSAPTRAQLCAQGKLGSALCDDL